MQQVLNLTVEDNHLFLKFKFNKEIIAKAKSLGMRWSPPKRYWYAKATKVFVENFLKTFPELYETASEDLSNYIIPKSQVMWFPSSYLMDHQRQGAERARVNSRWAFYHDIGVGKTVLGIEVIKQKRAKTLVVCPLSVIETAWMQDIKDFAPEIKVANLWALKQKTSPVARRFYKKSLEECDLALINFESFRTIKEKLEKVGFDMLIVDECFTANTLVDTSIGTKRIADVLVGDHVINCLGLSRVTKVRKKYIKNDSLSLTTIQGTDIISSKDHPFFTQRGWVKAKNLEKTDYVIYTKNAMRMVRKGIDEKADNIKKTPKEKEANNKNFLFSILFSEMENETTRNKKENIYSREKQKGKSGGQNFLSTKQPGSTGPARTGKTYKYNVESNYTSKGFCSSEKNGTQTKSSRRKRKTNSNSSTKIIREANQSLSESNLDVRICSSIGEKDKIISNKLQTRHSRHKSQIGNRSRWLQPYGDQETTSRQEKNEEAFGARVESTKIYKSSDSIFDEYRNERNRVVLYDLEIEGHPSFSIYGMLVHNSAKIKSYNSKITKAIIDFSDNMNFVYPLSGNPAPNSEMEYWSQMRIIDPMLFGPSFYSFRNEYFYSFGYGNFKWKMKEDRREEFLAKLASVSEVVRKEDVLDLPEKTNNIRKVYLDILERKAYEEMKRNLVIEFAGKEIIAVNAAVKQMKLREGTSGFYIDQDKKVTKVGQSKLNVLEELLEEIGDRQVVIWTHFHFEADEIERMLEKKNKLGLAWGRVDGTIKKQEDKIQTINKFKNGNIQYIIAHPGSIGHGVPSLVVCSYMIYFSLSHSWELFDQSSGRIHRKGQVNPCFYYFLIADRSVDEIIMKALEEKGSVAEAVFGYIRRSGR